MSTHRCDVIEVKLEKHENADALSIVRFGGYQCVVKTSDWKDGDLGVYIPPDSLVDTNRPEFSFLKKEGRDQERVKVVKLRGVISQGLLIPAPDGVGVGDCCMEHFGVEHYQPPMKSISSKGEDTNAPSGVYPKYDVENLNRYNQVLTLNENVVITEKIHGANARFTFKDGQMYCGSRTRWKKEYEHNLWWRALAQNPWIRDWCIVNPDLTIYGEVFGNVQDLKYGADKDTVFFRAFDIWHNVENRWLNWLEIPDTFRSVSIDSNYFRKVWVPILYEGPFDEEVARELAEGDSMIPDANHHAEGVVVCPMEERWEKSVGRVQLKIVGNRYLMKA